MTMQQFKQTVEKSVETFEQNSVLKKLRDKSITLKDYENVLLSIFHQTFEGPSTFALAAAHCDPRNHDLKSYFMKHADEEKDHWKWVVSDLKNIGYTGKDPSLQLAPTATHAYVAFNVYTAMRHPLSRLAIAIVLESIGASFGKKYATALCEQLSLKPNQAVFFFGHGDTDVGHTQELYEVLEKQSPSEDDFKKMTHAAQVAGELYAAIYESAL